MRVLHIYRTYFPDTQGGLEETIRQICLNTRDCVESRILCLSPNPSPSVLRRPEALVVRVKSHGEIASCNFSAHAFRALRRLAAWADIVHFHHPWPFADMLWFATNVRVPAVLTYHSDIVRQRVLGKFYAPLMHRFLRSVDRIVCTSPNYLALSPVLQRHREKVSVVPIGVDPSAYPKVDKVVREAMRRQHGEGFILFIGVLRYYKGLRVLLNALKGARVRCLIVGSGPDEADLRQLAAEGNLDNVTFTGYVDDTVKVALLDLCRAVVLPSYLHSEAFGVVLLESAMHGKPMITADTGSGTSHVNSSGETGLVVAPRSADALRDAMLRLHDDEALAQAMGSRARQRFEARFTGERMGSRYVEIYRSLLGQDGETRCE